MPPPVADWSHLDRFMEEEAAEIAGRNAASAAFADSNGDQWRDVAASGPLLPASLPPVSLPVPAPEAKAKAKAAAQGGARAKAKVKARAKAKTMPRSTVWIPGMADHDECLAIQVPGRTAPQLRYKLEMIRTEWLGTKCNKATKKGMLCKDHKGTPLPHAWFP